MTARLENINKLLNAGKIEQAFKSAIDFTKVNGRFEKELRTLFFSKKDSEGKEEDFGV